jgi:hypothetical protein
MEFPHAPMRWSHCYRTVPRRFPPFHPFARIGEPADYDVLDVLEGLTSNLRRYEAGELLVVPPGEESEGAGASCVMAPFVDPSPGGGRFTREGEGAYYTSLRLGTSVAETSYHRAGFMAATSQPPMGLEMQVLEAELEAYLMDVRDAGDTHPELYDSDDYSAAQSLGSRARAAGSDGIAYRSVREPGGECAALFRPRRIRECRPTKWLVYVWDGRRIAEVVERAEDGVSGNGEAAAPA